MPRGFLGRDKQSAHIDGDQLLKILQRKLLNRRESDDTRVVHKNINFPECPDGFRNRHPNGIRKETQQEQTEETEKEKKFSVHSVLSC